MKTLKEIEAAVEALSRDDLTAFREWFTGYDADAWDRQIEEDARAGKLDALAEAALRHVLPLPMDARSRIADELIESLDDEPDDDPVEVERAWAEEIRRRVEEMESGKVPGIPAEEVFAEARARLRRQRSSFDLRREPSFCER